MTSAEGLKQYLKNELTNKRAQLGISQERMSESLSISLRSYSNLEHGRYCCSLTTFINYVNCFDVDKDKLFADLADILNQDEE